MSAPITGAAGGKVSALITGAAGGIGRALTATLLARGASVAATDADEEALARSAREGGWPTDHLLVQRLDVREADDWGRCLQEAEARNGPLTLGLNVAGCLVGGPAIEHDAEDIARVLDVNARGTLIGSQAMARAMRPRKRGHIINFGSMTALMPSPGFAIYSASKYAVRGFSLALAEELRGSGIAVTLVSTGSVDTPMLAAQRAAGRVAPDARLLSPDAVAAAVLSDRVLERRPRELYLPLGKGLLARGIDLGRRACWACSSGCAGGASRQAGGWTG